MPRLRLAAKWSIVRAMKPLASQGTYPMLLVARYCPVCGEENKPRRLTKKILPKTVRVRWLCESCSTLFDVFMGGR